MLHGARHIQISVDDGSHRFGNRHVDGVTFSKSGGDGSRKSALHQPAGHVLAFTPAKRDAETQVARLVAGGGQHQIAKTGEAAYRIGLAAHGNDETRHFGKPARYQRRPGGITKARAFNDAGGNGEDIFECATKLHADAVCRGIKPEGLAGNRGRKPLGYCCIFRRNRHGRR